MAQKLEINVRSLSTYLKISLCSVNLKFYFFKLTSTFFEVLMLPHLLLSAARPTTIFEVGSSGNRLTPSCSAHLPFKELDVVHVTDLISPLVSQTCSCW